MITYKMETMNVSTRPDPDQRAGNSLWPLIKKIEKTTAPGGDYSIRTVLFLNVGILTIIF